MTINELLALAGLTASDEIPVWDAEGQVNGRTKKITAQNLAASIKTIASLIASSDLDTTPTSGSTKAVQSGGVYDAIQQSTAKNFQTGTYVAPQESVVQANADTTLLTATVTKTGRYIIIGFFGASSGSNAISLTIAVNGNSIRGNWKSLDKSISSISNLSAGDVVTLIANTTENVTFYRDVRNNNLLIAEI